MYRTTIEDQIVVKIARNSLYGLHAKVVLARGPDGALIPSNATIPNESSGKRETSKVILRGATARTESDNGAELKALVTIPGGDDILVRWIWFPKLTKKGVEIIKHDGDMWLVQPWIIKSKEEELAVSIGAASCKFLVGEGEIPKAEEKATEKEESKQQEEEQEEILF